MIQGDAQLVAHGCQKSAVCSLVVYLVNMAESDESQKYHHTKAADLQIVPMLLDILLGRVQTAHLTPSS